MIVMSGNDLVSAFFADDNTSVTPAEVVLFPERIYGENKGVHRVREDVDNHPTDMLPLALDDEDDSLKTIDRGDHDDGDERELTGSGGNEIDQVAKIDANRGKHDCAEKVDKDDEAHRKAAEATEVLEPNQFSEIVNSRVDPTSSLGDKN